MPPKTTCPSCEKSLTVPNDAAGRSVRCPVCSHRFKVPNHTDEDEAIDLPDDDEEGIVRRRRSGSTGRRIAIIVGVVAVVLFGIGSVVLLASKSKPTDQTEGVDTGDAPTLPKPASNAIAERDRDYMRVLENLYEIIALAQASQFWRRENNVAGFKDLRGLEATVVLTNSFDSSLKTSDFASVEARKIFMDYHGMDSKDWRPEFMKRYPERELINDEIRVVVHNHCSLRQTDISGHLVDQLVKITKELFKKADADPAFNRQMIRNGNKIIDDQWHEYRMRYLEKMGPKLVEEVREEVKKMDSIVRMKAKVEAAASGTKR